MNNLSAYIKYMFKPGRTTWSHSSGPEFKLFEFNFCIHHSLPDQHSSLLTKAKIEPSPEEKEEECCKIYEFLQISLSDLPDFFLMSVINTNRLSQLA